MSPSRLKVFAANRVGDICSRIPATQWRYVATDLNPADFTSRGLSPQELLQKVIWWEGPPWLQQDSEFWPRRPDINLARELPELKSKVLILQPLDDSLWRRYPSFDRLLRTVAWCRRFYSNCHHQDKEKSCRLTAEELDGARTRLLHLSQLQETLDCLQKRRELPAKCFLLSLRPLLGEDSLLRVGGRLQNAGLNYNSTHPIILSGKSPIVHLLAVQVHLQAKHASC